MRIYLFATLLMAAFTFIPSDGAAQNSYLGSKQCYTCHKDIKKAYLKNLHGKVFTKNPRNNLEERGCEACHGPGEKHKIAVDMEEEDGPMMIEAFRKGKGPYSGKNSVCLSCHRRGNRTHWQGSSHDMAEISCADCHNIHSEEDIDATRVCAGCHKQKRAQLMRSSHLPLREGNMTCADCHNPHGGKGDQLLKTATVNETCYECHEEKRGPLLWEHAPVREDCSSCHTSHGSNYPSLLKMKVPYLCQACHVTQLPHPRDLYDNSGLVPSAPSRFLIGKGCLNCHSLIHGSNHPSGARFMR